MVAKPIAPSTCTSQRTGLQVGTSQNSRYLAAAPDAIQTDAMPPARKDPTNIAIGRAMGSTGRVGTRDERHRETAASDRADCEWDEISPTEAHRRSLPRRSSSPLHR